MHYPHELESIQRNMTFHDDVVVVHYLLRGCNVTSASVESFEQAQRDHFSLLQKLASFGLPGTLYSFKARTHPQTLLERTVIPGLSQDTMPNYRAHLGAFAEKLRSGELKEFQRVYWLSMMIPRDIGWFNERLDDIFESDDVASYETHAQLEEDIFRAIPDVFKPVRANTDHFQWVFDRARYRGIKVPFMPPMQSEPTQRFSLTAFPSVLFEWNASGESLASDFAALHANNGKERKELKKSFWNNFRSTQFSTAMSVSNMAERRPELPNGPMSYQTHIHMLSGPSEPHLPYAQFTNIVDTITSVDADFAQYFNFDFSLMSKSTIRKLRSRMVSEGESLSKDDLDLEEYQDSANELEAWRRQLRSEAHPIPMTVSTHIVFAHQNLNTLDETVNAVLNMFEDNGYLFERIPGGQRDGFLQMLPGIAHSTLVEETKLPITASNYAASIPCRRSFIGDRQGFPFAINKSNALGQIAFLDLPNATEQGSGSIAAIGAQGSGKSHFIKLLLGVLFDMGKTVHLIDPSNHGEYEVFAKSLSDVTVVNLTRSDVSLDPLKLYDPDMAKQEFMSIIVPMLQVDLKSNGVALVSNMLDADYRRSRDIHSTRDLLRELKKRSEENSDLVEIYNALNLFASMPYTGVLIDRVDAAGRVIDTPPLNPTTQTVVYRTAGLATRDSDGRNELLPLFSQAALASIATFAHWRFSQINDLCAFVADELGRFKNNRVITDKIVSEIDTMGRKERNIVIAGSQLASHLDEGFELVRKRLILRQEKRDNAVAAFRWADIDPLPALVETMMHDTSPMDMNTKRTVPGREGEGWYNDGSNGMARVKILNHLLPERTRSADTTASRMIRA